MDLRDDALGFCGIELHPSLVESDVSVALVEVLGVESMDVFEGSLDQDLAGRLETRDHVGNSSLGLVEQLRLRNCSLFTATDTHFRDDGVVDHVVVSHQNLSFMTELVSQKDPPFVLFLVLELENQVKSRDFLANIAVVTPSDLIDILILDVTFDYAFSKLGLSTREIPLCQTNSLTSSLIFVLVDCFLRYFDIKQRIKSLNRQESAVRRVSLDLCSKALFKGLLELTSLILLIIRHLRLHFAL